MCLHEHLFGKCAYSGVQSLDHGVGLCLAESGCWCSSLLYGGGSYVTMHLCESWGDHVCCGKCVYVVGVSRNSGAHCYMVWGGAVCALEDASVCCNVCVHGVFSWNASMHFGPVLMGSVFMLWDMFVQ